MAEVNRRYVLATLAAGLMTKRQAFAAASPSQEIASASGSSATKWEGMQAAHLLVSQGRIPLSMGDDEAWGRPLGTITFGPEALHDLRSVSKSVVGLVYGMQ